MRKFLRAANPLRRILLAWKGRERLWVAYWLYWTLGVSLLTIVIGEPPGDVSAVVALAVVVGYFAYLVWAGVSVWRCASNSRSRWAVFARPVVGLALVAFLAGIYDLLTVS
jgi:hypothetical protein